MGRGKTSDGVLDVDLAFPVEMGGPGGATNPEQLLAIGYAACFESAMGVVARRERADVGDVKIESTVVLRDNDEKGYELDVALDVTMPSVDDTDTAVRIVEAAHEVCAYSNATRGNVNMKLTANGRAIDCE